MNGLVWLRSDLRIDDNPALNIADNECEKIVCLYLLSEKEWKTHNNANVKLDFIIQNLSNDFLFMKSAQPYFSNCRHC